MEDVEREFSFVQALDILGAAYAHQPMLHILEALMNKRGRYALCVRLASQFELNLEPVYAHLTEDCMEGLESWETLQTLLNESAQRGLALHGVALSTILKGEGQVPDWLLKCFSPGEGVLGFGLGGNPDLLLTTFLKRGRLLKAIELAWDFIPGNDQALVDTKYLRNAPWLAMEILDFMLSHSALILSEGVHHSQFVDVQDEDDTKYLRFAVNRLKSKLQDYFRGLAKLEPSRQALLRNL